MDPMKAISSFIPPYELNVTLVDDCDTIGRRYKFSFVAPIC